MNVYFWICFCVCIVRRCLHVVCMFGVCVSMIVVCVNMCWVCVLLYVYCCFYVEGVMVDCVFWECMCVHVH